MRGGSGLCSSLLRYVPEWRLRGHQGWPASLPLMLCDLPSPAAGGADRRGVDDGRQRPASVKASLSVALGQRAPNRAGAREEGRGLGAGMKGGVGERRRSPSLDRYRDDRRGREPRDRERDERRDERRRSRCGGYRGGQLGGEGG